MNKESDYLAIVKMPFSLFKLLSDDYEEIKLISIKDDLIDFSKFPQWVLAREKLKESTEKIKEIEQDIRFKLLK